MRVHPEARASTQPPCELAIWPAEVAKALAAWKAFPSSDLLEEDGLEAFALRSVALAQGSLPRVLLTELPLDPSRQIVNLQPRPASGGTSGNNGGRPAAGGKGGNNDRMSITDLAARHRGEVRELHGGQWVHMEKAEKEAKAAQHPQLVGLITQASGCGCSLRVSRVFSLMDLFVAHGDSFTAKELYEVYLSCPLIARRRKRLSRRA